VRRCALIKDVHCLIVLIGLPGSGKSTAGRQLARRLNLSFIDSDAEIEKYLTCSIREYFEREGEESFRDAEQAVIAELTRRDVNSAELSNSAKCILSTGGGAVLRQANRDNLRASGYVIYLRSNPDEIFKRLQHDRDRPLLQVEDPLQRLRDLYAERDPLYRETAHFVIDTGRPSVATLVSMIVMQLELAGVLSAGGAAPDGA
jgi:shikimate kinase